MGIAVRTVVVLYVQHKVVTLEICLFENWWTNLKCEDGYIPVKNKVTLSGPSMSKFISEFVSGFGHYNPGLVEHTLQWEIVW